MSELPNGWTTLSLGRAGRWMSGGTPSTSNPDYWGGDIPWIGSGSLTDFRLVDSDRRVTSDGVANGTRLVEPGTILMVVRGMSLKTDFRIGWATRPMAFGQDCKALVAGPGIDPTFLAYAILAKTPAVLGIVDEAGHGTGRLNTDQLFALTIALPQPAEQKQIAQVLGALDDKIAVNGKLASTAEALASALFAQAVHGVELSNNTFGDVAAVRGGGTPRTGVDEYWDGDINWVTPTDVTALSGPYLESTSRRITKEGLEACASPLYPPGSVMMTSRATIGAFAVAQQPTATNQGFIVVNPHDSSLNWWIFHEMRSRVDEFISLANGATFLELSRGNFKKFRVRLAEESTMKAFSVTADALHSRARQALVENARLAETRDVLLPQLMSGKIRVKDAEQNVGNVV